MSTSLQREKESLLQLERNLRDAKKSLIDTKKKEEKLLGELKTNLFKLSKNQNTWSEKLCNFYFESWLDRPDKLQESKDFYAASNKQFTDLQKMYTNQSTKLREIESQINSIKTRTESVMARLKEIKRLILDENNQASNVVTDVLISQSEENGIISIVVQHSIVDENGQPHAKNYTYFLKNSKWYALTRTSTHKECSVEKNKRLNKLLNL